MPSIPYQSANFDAVYKDFLGANFGPGRLISQIAQVNVVSAHGAAKLGAMKNSTMDRAGIKFDIWICSAPSLNA